MKIECPICKAPIHHLRVNDGEIISGVSSREEVIIISNILNYRHYHQ